MPEQIQARFRLCIGIHMCGQQVLILLKVVIDHPYGWGLLKICLDIDDRTQVCCSATELY